MGEMALSEVLVAGVGKSGPTSCALTGAAGVTLLPNPLSNSAAYKSGLVTVVGRLAASKLVL